MCKRTQQPMSAGLWIAAMFLFVCFACGVGFVIYLLLTSLY